MNLVGLGGCTADRTSQGALTGRTADTIVKILSIIYRGTVPATCCRTPPRGLESLLEGESQVTSQGSLFHGHPKHLDGLFDDVSYPRRDLNWNLLGFRYQLA